MMEAWVIVVLLVIGAPLALAVWLIVRAVTARGRIEELSRRIGALERKVFELTRGSAETPSTAEPEIRPTPTLAPALSNAPAKPAAAPIAPTTLPGPPTPKPTPAPPPLPPMRPVPTPASASRPPLPKPAPAINWEQFMGVKLFAWLGGLALFLGVAFFVKYSFEHNLVPPEVRVALGFLTGLALLAGGVWLHRRKAYVIGAQALCATGVVILYAVTFACRSIYHFEFFGPIPTFLLMTLITATAFVVAVRLNALVVALLGMVGGFLTPVLLSTGVDNPLGLFGYIAILDVGLILVALNRRWHFLTALAALGTALLQIGWADGFFVAEKYFAGNKILVALTVLLGFNALFFAANWWAKRAGQRNWWLAGAQLGLAAVALAFTAYFFAFEPLAHRPVLLFSFVFLVDLMITALVWLDDETTLAQPLAGLAVFGLLALWTTRWLNNDLLHPALAFYFIFAVFHAALPALWQRQRDERGGATPWSNFFPPLALLLVLLPIFKLEELSFLVWPFVLLVDVLAIGLAVLTGALLPVLVVLLLTLAATGALIFKIPTDLTGLPTSFFLLGAFTVFFVAVSVWLARKFTPDAFKSGLKLNDDLAAPGAVAAVLPACSALLPFLLLIMATLRLPLSDPAPVFGLALLLGVLLLGLTRLFSMNWLPVIGLAGVFALECAWHFNRLDPANPNLSPVAPLVWYLGFYALFAVFPFLFLKRFSDQTAPWLAAALAGPVQFFLVFRLVKLAWPNSVMGLLPAAFAIPALVGLVLLLKRIPVASKARLTQLALFGGVALFFITLIFPIQFDRQWITIGWALEGAALLWLFHRVPHEGLRLTGLGLLIAAFVRLALNPAVFDYQLRSATPIFNWYLYSYGLVTLALFAGARLLAPPRDRVFRLNAPGTLATLGTVLAFLLLNIQIADYFTPPGARLTFQFSGDFARDMTYSIAWALFALGLLVCGIWKKIPAARYAAMALLCLTLLKLFFHDLARLGQLYRIGAFIGVAVIAMLASFAYQKFYAATARETESENETTE